MGTVAKRVKGAAPIQFDPQSTRKVVLSLQAAVKHAVAMKDWKAYWEAIDWLIEEQRNFVAWWDGKCTPAGRRSTNVADLQQLSVAQLEAETDIHKYQVSRWRTGLARPDYRIRVATPTYSIALANAAQNRADLQTGQMEWFTPAEYIAAARAVLGEIDLDPASSDLAQKIVKAKTYYTRAQDGLKQPWFGRVWLNPPFASEYIAAFGAHLLKAWANLEITAAIMISNAYTETSWFHALAKPSQGICFTRGRIKFESPYGEKRSPTNGQSFFYFGPDPQRFATEFSRFGLIMTCHD